MRLEEVEDAMAQKQLARIFANPQPRTELQHHRQKYALAAVGRRRDPTGRYGAGTGCSEAQSQAHGAAWTALKQA